MSARLTIAISMGDPAGIGPEIVVKSLADPEIRRLANYIVYGLNEPMIYAADLAEIEPFWWRCAPQQADDFHSEVVMVDFDEFPEHFDAHVPSAASGQTSMAFCKGGIEAARSGKADAMVTAPISKHAWHLAGYKYPGHTELLGHSFSTRRVGMGFVAGPLRVALASIHVGLFDLRNRFTIGLVYNPIDLLHETLRDAFGIPNPKIAVCALNPHAGENGAFGDEEERIIKPAIEIARNAGIEALGPFPADTLFYHAAKGAYDGVVAMYHDQGLIPVKLLAFETAVNVTLGLPIVRTSPDHGTAFDIAGKNQANPSSFKEAIRLAVFLAKMRKPANISTHK